MVRHIKKIIIIALLNFMVLSHASTTAWAEGNLSVQVPEGVKIVVEKGGSLSGVKTNGCKLVTAHTLSFDFLTTVKFVEVSEKFMDLKKTEIEKIATEEFNLNMELARYSVNLVSKNETGTLRDSKNPPDYTLNAIIAYDVFPKERAEAFVKKIESLGYKTTLTSREFDSCQ